MGSTEQVGVLTSSVGCQGNTLSMLHRTSTMVMWTTVNRCLSSSYPYMPANISIDLTSEKNKSMV